MKDHLTIVKHPLVQHKLSLMRDKTAATPLFRQLLREVSQLLAYEITRELALTTERIQTPLEAMDAPVGFVGLYRDENTLQPVQYYFKVPDALEDRLIIAVDPMLATGNSSATAIDLLKNAGAKNIRFMCLLAAPEGVKRMKETHPDVPIVTAALDSHLNQKGYIVPGLGDAGDRMFGTK